MSVRIVVSGAALALLVGCVADQSLPTAFEVRAPLFATVARAGESHLRTHLSGAHEVFTPVNPGDPTPADSRAQGQAIFRVRDRKSVVEGKRVGLGGGA